jgi:hypothetical protein
VVAFAVEAEDVLEFEQLTQFDGDHIEKNNEDLAVSLDVLVLGLGLGFCFPLPLDGGEGLLCCLLGLFDSG